MGRTARNRRTYSPRPVQRVELSDRHMKGRLTAAVALLLVGVGALAYGVLSALSADAGWSQIEVSDATDSCAGDFVLLYDLGAGETSASAERKALTALYTQLARTAYRVFDNDRTFDGVVNVRSLNDHPNETLTVDDALYRALEQVQDSGDRTLYLGPVYERYNGAFACTEDYQLADYDPRLNPDVRAEFAETAAYAADPESVNVELLGDGRVRLAVSDDYLAYGQEREIHDWIDFYWMRNAFVADYLAERLSAQGYTRGALSSDDGFIRNLDAAGETSYSVNLYDRTEAGVYLAGVMAYRGPRSLVVLRNYPLNDRDARRFYRLADGRICTQYLDVADGLCKSAVNDLLLESDAMGCGELLLRAIPVYVADALDPQRLAALAADGIQSVYCRDFMIHATDPRIVVNSLYADERVKYALVVDGRD